MEEAPRGSEEREEERRETEGQRARQRDRETERETERGFSSPVIGFGSHTPMVTGHTYVVRYSPNAPRAIQVMKDVMLAQVRRYKQRILTVRYVCVLTNSYVQMGEHPKIDEEKK